MNTMIANPAKWFTTDDGATDIGFIRENEIVKSRGKIHSPISSAMVLEKFRNRAESFGLKFKNEQAALLKTKTVKDKKSGEEKVVGGDRFMYLAEVEDSFRPDYALSVGFRNFGDKTLSFSGMCAERIFVCQNGVCTGIVKPSKCRHTIGNMELNPAILDKKIDAIFTRFLEDSKSVHQQIEQMKGTKLSDEIVGKFVKKMIHSQYVGGRHLISMLEDLENPAYNDHDDNSVFRLMNACSAVTTHKMKNPNQQMLASRECNNIIMGLINPDFIPLGDVVDVAEEDVAEE